MVRYTTRVLEQNGVPVLHCPYKHATDLPELIGSMAGRVDRVVIGGGDGTLNAAAPGLLAASPPLGIIPLGTSMDFESQRSRDLGCWDGVSFCTPAIDALAGSVDDDWVIPVELVDAVLKEGLRGRATRGARILACGPPEELHR